VKVDVVGLLAIVNMDCCVPMEVDSDCNEVVDEEQE
jgi:hypothetical protein